MRWVLILLLAVAHCVLASSPVEAGTFYRGEMPAGADPNSRARSYQIYVPDSLPEGIAPPLVTVLHGCRQTEQNMIDETRFTELADQHGFVVVFPFVTSYTELRFENCWGFWFPEHRQEGRGEVADIRRIVDHAESEFQTDPARRYITGLSSGGAMAVAAAVAYSEDFAAAGAVAGLPYGEGAAAVGFVCGVSTQHRSVAQIVNDMRAEQTSPEEQRLVPMLVIHSVNDCAVPILNGRNIRDSWIRYYGADPRPASVSDCTTDGVSCQRSQYVDEDGTVVVATAFYSGPASGRTHYWVGDNAGPFADPTGPSATELLWSFFQDAALEPDLDAEVRISEATVQDRSITVVGMASSAESPIVSVRVRLDGDMPQAERDAEGLAAWSITFTDLPDNQVYTPVARLVLESGAEKVAFGPRLEVGTPVEILVEIGNWQQHLARGRIAVQGQPCLTAGLLGTCDSDFTMLFFEHEFAPFPVYAARESGPWYTFEENVPASEQ